MKDFLIRIDPAINLHETPVIPGAFTGPTQADVSKFWKALQGVKVEDFEFTTADGKTIAKYWIAWDMLNNFGWYKIGSIDQYLHWYYPENDADLLQLLLRTHDWTYQFADDHRSWAAGDLHWHKIKEVAERLPRETTERIWSDYAPKGYKLSDQF
jgi:hypothetical protein